MSNLVEVKIPTNANPFTVTVNGKKYSYPAGATVQVPPEVAEVIEQISRGPNLPPSSGGGSGGGGADILNANGVIKQQHLPEGYPYSGYKEIMPETALEFIEDMSAFVIMSGVDSSMFTIGKSYDVTYNGTVYECEAIDGTAMGASGKCFFGNLDALAGTGDNGIPFALIISPTETQAEEGMAAILAPLDGSESVTLSISGIVIELMNEKFVPKDPWVIWFDVVGLQVGTAIPEHQNYSNEEIINYLNAGKLVVLRYRNSDVEANWRIYHAHVMDTDGETLFGRHDGTAGTTIKVYKDGTFTTSGAL